MDLQQVRYLTFVLLLVLFTGFSGGHPTPKGSLKSLKLPSKWSVVKCFQLEGRCQLSCKKDEVEIYGVGGCRNACCVKRKKESMCETFCGGQCEADCSRQAGTELIGTRLCMDKKKTQCCVRQNEKPQCNNGETKGKCPKPPTIANAVASGPALTASNIVEGEKVRYSCKAGFAQTSGSQVRMCSNGAWSGKNIVCKQTCPKPPTYATSVATGAPVTASQIVEGDRVTYVCKPGYYGAVDHVHMTCFRGSWRGRVLDCQPRKCRAPPTETTFYFSPIKTVYNSGERIVQSCRSGYARTGGEAVRTCKLGTWKPENGSISCERACPTPAKLSGTALVQTTRGKPTEYTEGMSVKYHCLVGYGKVGGDDTRTCTAGRWSGDDILCKRTCPTPANLPGAALVPSPDGTPAVYTEGMSVKYHCLVGYGKVGGDATRTCTAGRWSGDDILCKRTCIAPPAIPNTSSSHGQFTHFYMEGAAILYLCQPGFAQIDGDAIRTCRSGTWTGTDIKCDKICQPPPRLENGRLLGNLTAVYTSGDKANYTCVPGYTSNGPISVLCGEDGKWTNLDAKTCKRTCPTPPTFPHATLTLPQASQTQVEGAIAVYSCTLGYMNSGTAPVVIKTCTNGKWSGGTLDCKQDTCPTPPKIPNAVAGQSSTSHGSTVQYTCLPGHTNLGNVTPMTCVYGEWKMAGTMTCTKACPDPPKLTGAHITSVARKFYLEGHNVTYQCERGYQSTTYPETVHTKMCTNSVWKGTDFTCKRVCQSPPDVKNAVVTPPQPPFFEGTVVQYTCIPGLVAVNRTALKTCVGGNWTGDDIDCQKVCAQLPYVENTNVIMNHVPGGRLIEGARVIHRCQTGYTQVGGNSLRVCHDSSWTGKDIQCEKSCQAPPAIRNTELADTSSTYRHGTEVRYQCVNGTLKVGGSETKQCVSGNWSAPDDLHCEKPCSRPPHFPLSRRVLLKVGPYVPEHYVQGNQVKYECRPGYENINTGDIKTCEDGRWVGADVNCQKLTTTTTVTTVTTTEKPIPTTETKEPFAGGTKPTPTPKIIDPVEPGSGDAEKDDNLGLVEEIL
ncbi:sushi, von Willebrand factor type A, EGF and pentraxin domain-containing protein 1-like isoform X2 [Lingula anatina]|uniref:Sushi, von Willebrand factor type A, EGF and pentraxin domain-containing protein 1-like isoform X2 n=1 Tax=Lingula anatina TaxID=7574 RepID=A0A1S3J4Y7_LINAN|nr:sushi, von Willebrand factor type A, EGF and pentraxin domain-containing protein 1-like isoform X2 [Lingula anatina]|eukprot:XP_013405348.1 sushi, von Willebrand factor type A, EGF and pentraxin domain-containing protein 1-like isoform X2 [Lingula anatina]